MLDFKQIASNSRPQTRESILKETDNKNYDWWKQVTLKHGSLEDIENLYKQKEFLYQ